MKIDDDEITGIEILSVSTPAEVERIRRIREKEDKERKPNQSVTFLSRDCTQEEEAHFMREFMKPSKTKFSELK